MYYYYQRNMYIELRRDAMSYYAGALQDHIFDAKNMGELQKHLSRDPRFEVALLSHKKKILYTSAPALVFPFHLGFYKYDHHYFFTDTIELQHLKKVRYLLVRADSIEPLLEKTRKSIYLFLIFSILFLSVVIYVLGKLFLHPVRDTIHKLDRFIRDTTHELNTPLSVITMSIEQLNKEELLPKQRKHVERISVASKTISNLYNDLTFLLMHDQSKQHNTLLDIKALLQERIEYFNPIAEAKKITIRTDLKAAAFRIDREHMIRLIDNLLSNAIKYNRPSGEIYITLEPQSLSIRDTGIGISKEVIEHIFQRYTRFDEANGGFGIGLNIVQMITQKYQLEIAVRSETAEGSEFKVSWDKSSH